MNELTSQPGLVAVIGIALAVHQFAGIVGHVVAPRDRGGDAGKGVVIFVESIRWLGVPWGMRTVAAGLRDAGFEGEFVYWRWHATWRGWLVLAAIMDRALLEREAVRLAKKIEQTQPPVYVIGYSCGAFVTVRALELLAAETSVAGAVLLAAAVSPRHDLAGAASYVRGAIVNCSSAADWLIVGLGTLLFGTGGRRHTPSAGMTGFSAANARGVKNLQELRWKPQMAPCGHWGGHFAASARKFIALHVAGRIGIGSQGR